MLQQAGIRDTSSYQPCRSERGSRRRQSRVLQQGIALRVGQLLQAAQRCNPAAMRERRGLCCSMAVIAGGDLCCHRLQLSIW